MYYLLYTDKLIREPRYRNIKVSKRNKFRLDYIRKSISNRFKIHVDANNDNTDPFVYSVVDLAYRSCNNYSNHNPFVLEVDDKDAVWAKLAHDQITKNNDRYGMKFHGTIGPFTKEDAKLANYLKEEFFNFNHMVQIFISAEYNTFSYMHDNSFPETLEVIAERKEKFPYGNIAEKLLNHVEDFNARMESMKSMYNKTYSDFNEVCDYFREKASNLKESNLAKIKDILKAKVI